ncbi:hypothetical protein MKX03_019809 [Papaver bracteatum]|nr:hypothetical protein MKX03_019809 [Papaver bracteatum]
MAPSTPQISEADTQDPSQYYENRNTWLASQKASGKEPYPHKFLVSMTLAEYIKAYETLGQGEQLAKVEVSLGGRIMQKRTSSSKLLFYDLHDEGLKVQLIVDARHSDMDEAAFTRFHSGVKRGDIVGVTGFPGKSKRGELILSPCLCMMPRNKAGPGSDNSNIAKKIDPWVPGSARNPESYTLKDQETRYRQRYLDLMLNPEVRKIFRTLGKVVKYIRKFLDYLDFEEVETPMMSMIADRAAANQVITNTTRISSCVPTQGKILGPSLLKRLVVGGFNRVYEIGKQFRNEGIDLTHNPEFHYQMLSGMVKELTGGYIIKYHANGMDKDPIEIDFTPFRRIEMIGELEKMAGIEIPKDLSSDITNKCLLDACIKFNVKCPPPQTTSRRVNPTFITDHPEIMSPLAKSHRSKQGLTERFELFINKHELCNAYTELNDSVVQCARFAEQLKDRQSGDDEAMAFDEDFCKALDYGLPPTAGWGLGIDRLTMLLTDSQNIKEVIFFPAMKPQDEPAPKAT